MKYLDDDPMVESFMTDEEKKTYLPYNFSDESFRKLNPPDYVKDIKKESSINQVVSATYPEELDVFFNSVDPKLFNSEQRQWTKCQRPWIECKTNLTPIIEQRKRSQKNYFEKINELLY